MIPIEIKVIILGGLLAILLELWKKKKAEKKRQERLHKIKWYKKTFVKILNVATIIQKIDTTKSLRLINQGKHILSLSIKPLMVIVINCLSIFVQQVVRFNGCEIT